MSVGFVYRSVWRMVPSRMTVVSRNDTLSWDYCAVNLILGWKVFICRNCCNCSLPSLQTAEKSSLYLRQMDGLFTMLWGRRFSSSPMKILA